MMKGKKMITLRKNERKKERKTEKREIKIKIEKRGKDLHRALNMVHDVTRKNEGDNKEKE